MKYTKNNFICDCMEVKGHNETCPVCKMSARDITIRMKKIKKNTNKKKASLLAWKKRKSNAG